MVFGNSCKFVQGSGFFLFLNTFRLSSLVLQEDFVNLFGCIDYRLCFIFVLFE